MVYNQELQQLLAILEMFQLNFSILALYAT